MLAFGVHQCVDHHDGHDDYSHYDEVLIGQDGLTNRYGLCECAVGNFLKIRFFRCHGQRNGTRKTRMPHHKSTISRSDKQAVVHATQLLSDFLGEDDTHDEAKAPVEPASQGRDARHQSNSASRCLRQACQGTDAFLNRRCRSQGRARHKHQGHLHGKSQQRPHAIAPMLDHLKWCLLTHRHGDDEGQQGQHYGKDKRLREIFLNEFYAKTDDFLEHGWDLRFKDSKIRDLRFKDWLSAVSNQL